MPWEFLENVKECLMKGTEINQACFVPDCLTKCMSILLCNAYISRGWQMQTWCPSASLRSQLSFAVACAWNRRYWQVVFFYYLALGVRISSLWWEEDISMFLHSYFSKKTSDTLSQKQMFIWKQMNISPWNCCYTQSYIHIFVKYIYIKSVLLPIAVLCWRSRRAFHNTSVRFTKTF